MEAKSEIPELPTEIIFFHILPRLPTKLVIRCRCVCKSWSSLTRHPSFLAVHRSFRCSPSTHILFTNIDEAASLQNLYSVKLNQDEGEKNSTIDPAKHVLSLPARPYDSILPGDSINGLTILGGMLNAKAVYVFNPCSQEILTLPPTTNLEYDLFIHNLGFSAVTYEYKILQVHYWYGVSDDRDKYVTSMRLRIFTLGTTSWRDIDLDFPIDPHSKDISSHFKGKSVCLHGGIHWVDRNLKTIVVFDVGAERFRADNVPLPGDFDDESILEVGGCVAVHDHISNAQDFMLLWILEDYENHVWVKKTIKFPSSWEKLGFPIPVGTIHTGELLFKTLVHNGDDNCVLYLYNFEIDIFRKCKISLPVKTGRWRWLTSYEENVISLRS